MLHIQDSTARWGARVGGLVALLAAVACADYATGPVSAPAPGQEAYGPPSAVLVGAGDIATCDSSADEATAALLDGIAGTVFTLGDNAYPDGTAEQYAACYHPSWGRHRARTRPAAGNHDYRTRRGAPYYAYFGPRAGEPGGGYYSYDLGGWHIVVLNSEIDMDAESEQMMWLARDLAANPARCTAAYWHHPRYSSGSHGSHSRLRAAWKALYDAGAEVVLSGHDHDYERFGPQGPDGAADPARGLRQFVVGTGGKRLRGFRRAEPNSEVRIDDAHGVLRVDLYPDGYRWSFLSTDGRVLDRGRSSCH